MKWKWNIKPILLNVWTSYIITVINNKTFLCLRTQGLKLDYFESQFLHFTNCKLQTLAL